MITAPTGRGKSTFVLYKLLEHIISQNGKILYLVNRKILKAQIEEEIIKNVEPHMYEVFGKRLINIRDYIQVTTYQYFEKMIKSNIGSTVNWLKQFTHIVADECHYFYADSNFNTNTELSFDCIKREFDNKVQIYISATMDNVKKYIVERRASYFSESEKNYYHALREKAFERGKNFYEYSLERDYGYLNIHMFEMADELVKTIIDSRTKWLVFIDSKENGKTLKELLVKELEKQDALAEERVVFIDADYENDDSAEKEVKNIIESKFTGKRVIISTAVMDNGISFVDTELRNIVIMADDKESFIQMLGRKREDGKKVDLYICLRDKQHFVRRKTYVDKVIGFCDFYEQNISNIYRWGYQGKELILVPYTKALYLNGIAYKDILEGFYRGTNLLFDLKNQSILLENMMNNSETYQNASKVCYSVDGLLALNGFSYHRLKDLQVFYKNMSAKFDNDVLAFVKEQLTWLGKNEEEIKEIILSNEMRYKKILVDKFDSLVERELSTEQFKQVKSDIFLRNALAYYYSKTVDWEEKIRRSIKRKDGTLDSKIFNLIMNEAELPYTLRKEGKSIFVIGKNDM